MVIFLQPLRLMLKDRECQNEQKHEKKFQKPLQNNFRANNSSDTEPCSTDTVFNKLYNVFQQQFCIFQRGDVHTFADRHCLRYK